MWIEESRFDENRAFHSSVQRVLDFWGWYLFSARPGWHSSLEDSTSSVPVSRPQIRSPTAFRVDWICNFFTAIRVLPILELRQVFSPRLTASVTSDLFAFILHSLYDISCFVIMSNFLRFFRNLHKTKACSIIHWISSTMCQIKSVSDTWMSSRRNLAETVKLLFVGRAVQSGGFAYNEFGITSRRQSCTTDSWRYVLNFCNV